MRCASVQALETVMDMCRNMHAGLMGCLPWGHTSAMDMCHGHMWVVTWLCGTVKRACLAPSWLGFGSLVAHFGIKIGIISWDVTLHSVYISME